MRPRKLFVLFTSLLACTATLGRDSPYAIIGTKSSVHPAGGECNGGDLTGFQEITKLPDKVGPKQKLNELKLEPGLYQIRYEYSRRNVIDGECFEGEAARYQDPQRDSAVTTLKVDAGKVYRLSLRDDFSVAVEVLSELPLDQEVVGALYETVGGIRNWTAECVELFPPERDRYLSAYQKSSLSQYADLFGIPESSVSGEKLSRGERLERLGQTELQAQDWCHQDFFSEIEKFDYMYRDRVNDVGKLFESLKSAAGSRP